MNKKEHVFVQTVWDFYTATGRHNLPWRRAITPYKILVSELMLQQTQVDRVLPKYRAFLAKWPSVAALAGASQADVLRAWQGLGYNRRAKFLHQVAREVTVKYGGRFPKDELGLQRLPGVGPYTASAIMAFAYNRPTVMIETNIRQVFLHHFFPKQKNVTDADILELVQKTSSPNDPREWYWALMDYGAHLKQLHGNLNHRSEQYTKQSTFKGSDREIRGAILRVLAAEQELSKKTLLAALSAFDVARIRKQLAALIAEDLIVETDGQYSLR